MAMLCTHDVMDLVRKMPALLDQDYHSLCDEAEIGKGPAVIQAARRVYDVHRHLKAVPDDQAPVLDERLRQAAYAVNAVIETVEAGRAVLTLRLIRSAYELLDNMARRLGMSAHDLQRSCV